MSDMMMQTYRNTRDEAVRFSLQLDLSGMTEFDVPPGGTCSGPVAYASFFARNGLVPCEPESSASSPSAKIPVSQGGEEEVTDEIAAAAEKPRRRKAR